MDKPLIQEIYDIAIIGAGPAGLTAAIYAQRGEAKTVIIDPGAPGGKMVKTSDIDNYPGFQTILGPDLSVNMFLQTQELNVPFIGSQVCHVIPHPNKPFEIVLDKGKIILSYAVIASTGTVERLVGAVGEREFYGRGVSNCAVCDGAFFKGDKVVVIGGGYAAFEESIFLTKFASQVTIVHRSEHFRVGAAMVKKAQSNPKIRFELNSVLLKITGDKDVSGAVIKNTLSQKETELECKAVFPFIGSDPVSEFLQNLDILDKSGYVIVNNKNETTIPGLFAAGDVTTTALRQITTAIGDGAQCGQFAIHYVDDLQEKMKNK